MSTSVYTTKFTFDKYVRTQRAFAFIQTYSTVPISAHHCDFLTYLGRMNCLYEINLPGFEQRSVRFRLEKSEFVISCGANRKLYNQKYECISIMCVCMIYGRLACDLRLEPFCAYSLNVHVRTYHNMYIT